MRSIKNFQQFVFSWILNLLLKRAIFLKSVFFDEPIKRLSSLRLKVYLLEPMNIPTQMQFCIRVIRFKAWKIKLTIDFELIYSYPRRVGDSRWFEISLFYDFNFDVL